MNKHLTYRLWAIFVISSLMVHLTGFAQMKDTGKVPITTTSEEALQDFLKGRGLFENLLVKESLQHFEQAISKDPHFAMAHLYSANSQPTAKGFFEELGIAVSLVANVSEAERWWILGVQAGANGMPLKQRELFKKLVDAYPNDERAHGLLGNHYFGQQMYKEAIQEYNAAININPDYPQVYNQLGYSQRSLGNYKEAEKAFQKYTELIPNDPNPYDSYAELKMKMGEYRASIDLYRKALKENPNFPSSHIGIATDYNFLGEYEKAREQLQTLFDSARDNGERRQARFAMAVSYVDQGNYDKALEEINWMLTTANKSNDAAAMAGDLGNMGNIYFEMGEYDKALQQYEKALQTMRESNLDKEVKHNAERFYLYNAGKVDLKKGDLKSAKEKSEQFMTEASKAGNTFQIWLAHELEGMIATKEKNYNKAINEFNQANQQNPYTFYRIAWAYEGVGNQAKAKEYYEKAANHNTLNSLNYAFIRTKAQKMVTSM